MRSVGCGSIRSRLRHGTGGRTLRQLESYKVPVGVAGSFCVRPAAWTKSGEKPSRGSESGCATSPRPVAIRRADARAAGRSGDGGPGVSQVARSVVAGSFCVWRSNPEALDTFVYNGRTVDHPFRSFHSFWSNERSTTCRFKEGSKLAVGYNAYVDG